MLAIKMLDLILLIFYALMERNFVLKGFVIMRVKHIFVTGGVVSGLGKGITASSLGKLLKSRGLNVTMQKLDPYINIDPGTMSPYQHGEVFVTDDGAETDLDVGHYERFIDENLGKFSNITAGKIYQNVMNKEREGHYLGETIQVIPHITNEIKNYIYNTNNPNSNIDVIITEIGGTVGDIESLPFIEAIRQVRADLGYENTLYVHVTLIPFIKSSEEIKTKPTQHSVKELMQIGIVPDIIVCRTSKHLLNEHKEKIALFCNIPKENVFENYDANSIYDVPIMLESQGLSEIVCKHFRIESDKINLDDWNELLLKQKEIKVKNKKVTIALVGKYVIMKDAYISYTEALGHAGISNDTNVDIKWIQAEDLEKNTDFGEIFEGCNAIIVSGGFGSRGILGKVNAIQYARENNIPFLGVCLGMQLMAIEFARNVLKLENANSTEFDKETKHPIVLMMEEQKKIILKGATMRLGSFNCVLKKDSLAYKVYDTNIIKERHRHRFELNPLYKNEMKSKGFIITGTLEGNDDIAEIAEISGHPFMVGVQFHPEFKSRFNRPHPLFVSLVEEAKKYKSIETGH